MIWISKNSNGEKTVFEKKGSDVRSMKINKENTQSFVTLQARAKEWFAMKPMGWQK
tara:strand:+ start:390 stop:557 length:168 start_codon:yes stop_codon:yes gene_type:complete